MRILHVNTLDDGGGAARVSRKLFEAYRAIGHQTWLAVGVKRLDDPDIFSISHAPAAGVWGRPWWRVYDRLRPRPGRAAKAARAAATLATPRKILSRRSGLEDFDFPGTRRLLEITPEAPDLVHLHNLHGDYFDLRELEHLSRTVPVVITLHDAWMFTGHCAYFLDCERWEHGCGSCPYLDTYPAVRRDNTHRNWLRKKQIYERSSLFIAAPSQWLLERAERSILSKGIVDTRLIPNGVDLSIFHPGDKASARESIGLSQDELILLFSGFSPGSSSYKDVSTLRAAAEIVGTRAGTDRVTLVVLGGSGEPQRIGSTRVLFAGYEADESKVAGFYQAADVYVHAARVGAENHSLAVLEALACGVPVVATAVGGTPEQVKSLHPVPSGTGDRVGEDSATGILTPPEDPEALAAAVVSVIEDGDLLRALSRNAAQDARRRFDLRTQVDAYLDWYAEIVARTRQRTA